MLRFVGRALGFLAFLLIATPLLGEAALRATGIADRTLVDSLYFTGYDHPVHRISETPGLFYELAPGATMKSETFYNEVSPVPADLAPGDLGEDGARRYTVSISEHGTRGPTYPEPKARDVFRIHFHGASTLYGAGMNNHETIAAYLEEALAGLIPEDRRVEVWNYGTSAYVLTQMGLLAQREMRDHDPDLVLILHTNTGRRAFLSEMEDDYYREAFELQPELYRENFILDCEEWHRDWTQLMPYSRLYESLLLAKIRGKLRECRGSSEETQFTLLPELVAEADERGVELLFVAAPGEPSQSRESVYPDLPEERFFSLQLMDREAVFYDAHPSPRILKEHGIRLAGELARRGLVPTAGTPPTREEEGFPGRIP